MSRDFTWWLWAVPREHEDEVQTAFDRARAAGLSEQSRRAHEAWTEDPGFLAAACDEIDGLQARRVSESELARRMDAVREALRAGDAEAARRLARDEASESAWRPYNAFLEAFCLPAFLSIAGKVVLGNFAFEPSDETSLGTGATINRLPPAALLWTALGPERAAKLPGFFANLFVPASDVVETERSLKSLLRVKHAEAAKRARESLRHSRFEDADVAKVLRCWPEALAQARKRKAGLLALSAMVGDLPDD